MNKVGNGHGWVYPNPDGSKARCGGPGLCISCTQEQHVKQRNDAYERENAKYEWAIVVANKRFRHESRERAEKAYAATIEACNGDATMVNLVRRPIGEWETVK